MFEVFFREKNGKETIIGNRRELFDAERLKLDSEKLAKVWECEDKYSYHVRKVK